MITHLTVGYWTRSANGDDSRCDLQYMDGIIPLSSALFSKSSKLICASYSYSGEWRYSRGLKGDPDYVLTNADGTVGQIYPGDGGDAYIHFDIYGEGLYIIWTGTMSHTAGLSGLATSPPRSNIGGVYSYTLYVTNNYDVYALPSPGTSVYCGNGKYVTSTVGNFGYRNDSGCVVYIAE